MGENDSLEERIRNYQTREQDPGGLLPLDWFLLILTGILLPVACLILGWLVGW
jgi:hypothetical protein